VLPPSTRQEESECVQLKIIAPKRQNMSGSLG
jgi:hypothetical protein